LDCRRVYFVVVGRRIKVVKLFDVSAHSFRKAKVKR
jgi:hypothetical protein